MPNQRDSRPDSSDDESDAERDALERALAEIPDEVGEDVDLSEGDPGLTQLIDMLPKGKPMPPDLAALYREVRNQAMLRAVLPNRPPVPFERFEAFDAMIGGMGLVLKARDPKLDRPVAIKLWIQSGPAAQAALLAEARTLAKFTHPNVVTIHEAGIWNDRAYFVMEWVDGMDGSAWMETAPGWFAIREAFACAGDGLATAHDVGIQHRDFKPANMLIGHDGRVLVADFGVASSLHDADAEQTGSIVGTPTYMAPERLRGEQGDARSDQFSFCVTLWRALYGIRPFAGAERDELLASMERNELRDDPSVDVPPRLREVVLRGLALNPDDRHPNMHALVDALLTEPFGADEVGDGSVQALDVDDDPRGRVLHAPRLQPWGAFGATLGLMFVAVLAGFGAGRSAEAPAPVLPPESPFVEPVMPSEEPCEGAIAADIDPVVVQVCRLIRLDEFQAATMLWELEYDKRKVEDSISAGEGASVVSNTFLSQAVSLRPMNRNRSDTAATLAMTWANEAASQLGNDDILTSHIRSEVRRLRDEISP